MLRDDGKTGSQGRRRWLYASVPDAFRCQRDAQDNLRPGPFLAADQLVGVKLLLISRGGHALYLLDPAVQLVKELVGDLRDRKSVV